MFGPNTYIKDKSSIQFSHRDKKFINLLKSVKNKFSQRFELNDYDILFIPGSGTIGMESIFFSIKISINVIGNEGVFKKKWEEFNKIYKKNSSSNVDLFCALETSNSSIFEKQSSIVDAISSFPYYEIPKNTKIFATCSNKQIGSFPGLSIVAVRKDFWKNLESSDVFSYLNLRRYLDFGLINQTPSTTPTQIFEHLEKTIDSFSITKLRDKININSQKVVSALGKENITGETQCPVITVKKDIIPKNIAQKFNLYGLNTNSQYYQIFTYSCLDIDYDRFCEDIIKR